MVVGGFSDSALFLLCVRAGALLVLWIYTLLNFGIYVDTCHPSVLDGRNMFAFPPVIVLVNARQLATNVTFAQATQ